MENSYEKIRLIAVSISLFLLTFDTVEGKDWRGITPLRSTMEDVKLLLNSDLKFNYFSSESETVIFHYKKAEGQNYGQFARCDIPVGTVYAITVNFKDGLPRSVFEDKNIKFERIFSCIPNSFRHYNKNEGLNISANEKLVGTIIYLPTIQDIDYFKCPTDFN